MTVARLIEILKDASPDSEVLIVHSEWPIKQVIIEDDKVRIQ